MEEIKVIQEDKVAKRGAPINILSSQSDKEQEEEKENNVVDLHSITGGGGTDKDWLIKLAPGTVFLFKAMTSSHPNQPNIGVSRAEVIFHYDACTLLLDNLNHETFFIVDRGPFCNFHRKMQVIETPLQEEVP